MSTFAPWLLTKIATVPTASVGDASVVEGNPQPVAPYGQKTMQFRVDLDKPAPYQLSVHYATSDGSATAGSDYIAEAQKVVFLPGEQHKTITITIKPDRIHEADETLHVTLSDPFNVRIGRGVATGTIINND